MNLVVIIRSVTKPKSIKSIADCVRNASPHHEACDEESRDAISSQQNVSMLTGSSKLHLDKVLKGIDALEKNVSKQEFFLPLLGYGPAIFNDPFPSDSYKNLLTKLKTLSSTCRTLRRAITQQGQNGL